MRNAHRCNESQLFADVYEAKDLMMKLWRRARGSQNVSDIHKQLLQVRLRIRND